MPSQTRRILLQRAHEELKSLPRHPDAGDTETLKRREHLELLIDQLTEGILSPIVLDAVTDSRRPAAP